MMYSATLLVSLLASSHGFASTPDDPIKPIYPPAAKHDPYDQLPAVPSFELTSETVTHGATAWSEWLCLRSCPYVAAHRCLSQ